MKTRFLFITLLLVLLPSHRSAAAQQKPDAAPQIPIKVDHAQDAPITPEEIREILNNGRYILSHVKSSPPGGVLTILPLHFTDDLGLFRHSGIVSSCTDLEDAFKDASADVHVVNEIYCCGGIKPGILGCSGENRPLIVFSDRNKEWSALTKGILWMHEYGHHKGLGHRVSNFAIMSPNIGSQHTQVNQCESIHFTGPPGSCGGDSNNNDSPLPSDVSAFVHRVYIEGISYDQASSFSVEKSFQPLLDILNDDNADFRGPMQELYRANAITVLGMMGDMRAFEPLKSFLENGSKHVPPTSTLSTWNIAREAVPIALGYLLEKNRNKSQDPVYLQVRNYLLAGLRPKHWPEIIVGVGDKSADQSVRNAHLTTMSLLGLALSGDDKAVQPLQELLNTLSLDSQNAEFEQGTARLVNEALRVNSRVQEVGLSKYYQESEQEQLHQEK